MAILSFFDLSLSFTILLYYDIIYVDNSTQRRMRNMKKEELKKQLQDFYEDPALREFRPVIELMLDTIDDPDDNDIAEILHLMPMCQYSYNCNLLAKGAHRNACLQ